MNTLTNEQVKEIGKVIDSHVGVLLKVTTGEGGKVSQDLLKHLGLPSDTTSAIEDAFVLGKLIQLLEENDLQNMSFEDLKKRAEEFSLSTTDRNSLQFARQKAAKYVTALGTDMKNQIDGTISRANHQANLQVAEQNIIRDKVAQAILKEQTRGKLTSELGHEFEDWRRDWRRVAHTELWNAKLQGEVITILQGNSIYSNDRGQTRVFRRPHPDACQHCKRLYLESDGVTPKVFKLSELVSNGTNVGKKVSEWLPITGTTHPNCSCPLSVIPEGFEFNTKGEMVFKEG